MLVDCLPSLIQYPLVGGVFPHGGGLHPDVIPRTCPLALYGVTGGSGEGNVGVPFGTSSSLSPPCTNFSNKSTMVRVMTKRHSDTDASKPSSQVGCLPQDIVTLRGDPASPPPHPPCPSTLGYFSTPLTKIAGHVDQRHGVHQFRNCLVSLIARGSKIDVQITKHDG